jgi:hypothetical protein
MQPVYVECYSGHTYAQEPRVIIWRGFRAPVSQVKHAWRTPDGPAFRVSLDDGAIVNLHFIEARDQWLISDQHLPFSQDEYHA